MEYRLLGRTGLRVSPLCFGTMSFGGDADEATSAELYSAVRERGINFLDCADAYGKGRAEEILGRLMAHERGALIVTTKCHGPMGEDPNARGSSRRHILSAVEASLRRLGTDRIEVLFMHRWEPTVPAEETLRALEDLVRAGKVLHVGVSNWSAGSTAPPPAELMSGAAGARLMTERWGAVCGARRIHGSRSAESRRLQIFASGADVSPADLQCLAIYASGADPADGLRS